MKVFVGVRVRGIVGPDDVMVATTLKGVCDATGTSYNTAKAQKSDHNWTWLLKNQDTKDVWCIVEKDVIKVKGRRSVSIG